MPAGGAAALLMACCAGGFRGVGGALGCPFSIPLSAAGAGRRAAAAPAVSESAPQRRRLGMLAAGTAACSGAASAGVCTCWRHRSCCHTGTDVQAHRLFREQPQAADISTFRIQSKLKIGSSTQDEQHLCFDGSCWS